MSYYRVVLKGSIGVVEVWSTSINYGVFGLSPDTPNQDGVDAISLALSTWINATNMPASLRLLMSTGSSIDTVRVEQRSETEATLAISERLLATSLPGSGAPNKTPQDCLVFSLRTNTPGARGRGRLYWPALQATLSASYQLTTPAPATVVADVKTFLSGIGSQMNAAFASISQVRTVVLSVRSVTDHVCRDVVKLQVGSILDTQRRRRDSLPESYVAVAYP